MQNFVPHFHSHFFSDCRNCKFFWKLGKLIQNELGCCRGDFFSELEVEGAAFKNGLGNFTIANFFIRVH